jgi:hypothetical protein
MNLTHLVKTALISTVFVLATVFILNRIAFTRNLVQTALLS